MVRTQMVHGVPSHRPRIVALEPERREGRVPALPLPRRAASLRQRDRAGQRLRPRPGGRGHLPAHTHGRRGLQTVPAPVGRLPGRAGHPRRLGPHAPRIGLRRADRRGRRPRQGRLAGRHERLPRPHARMASRTVARTGAHAHAEHGRTARSRHRIAQAHAVLASRRSDGRMDARKREDRGPGRGAAHAGRRGGASRGDPGREAPPRAFEAADPVRPDRAAEGHERPARAHRRTDPGLPAAHVRDEDRHLPPHRFAVHHPRRRGGAGGTAAAPVRAGLPRPGARRRDPRPVFRGRFRPDAMRRRRQGTGAHRDTPHEASHLRRVPA